MKAKLPAKRMKEETRKIVPQKIPSHNPKYELNLTPRSLFQLKLKRSDAISLHYSGDSKTSEKQIKLLIAQMSSMKKLKKIEFQCENCASLRDLDLKFLFESLTRLNSLESIKMNFVGSRTKKMTAKCLKSISQNIRKLTHLKIFHFKINLFGKITNKDLQFFNQGIRKLASLKSIDIDFNVIPKQITEPGLQSINKSIKSMLSLQSLAWKFFWSENFTDKLLENLGKNLKKLKFLKKIKLNFHSCDKITNIGLKNFSKHLSSLTKLESIILNFSSCKNLSDQGLQDFSRNLEKLKFLKSLNLNLKKYFTSVEQTKDLSSPITDEGIKSLSELVEKLTSLESLNINLSLRDTITDQGFTYLMESLKKLCSLNSLNLELQNCHLGDKSLKSLSECLRKFDNLQTFDFNVWESTTFSDFGLKILAENLKKSLKHLSINFQESPNPTEDTQEILYKNIQNLTSLQSLSLVTNRAFSENNINTLAKSVKSLKSLSSFFLNFYLAELLSLKSRDHLEKNLRSLKSIKEMRIHPSKSAPTIYTKTQRPKRIFGTVTL